MPFMFHYAYSVGSLYGCEVWRIDGLATAADYVN